MDMHKGKKITHYFTSTWKWAFFLYMCITVFFPLCMYLLTHILFFLKLNHSIHIPLLSYFFPLLFKINFYWSIVGLQCCIGFYYTAKWISWLFYFLILRCSVMSDSLWPQGLQPTRLPCPWDSPGNNTGVGCHCLLRQLCMGTQK